MATRRVKKGDADILKEARARYKEAQEADKDNRKEALDDLKFAWNLDNHQWPEESRKLRTGRPCLTENRLPQFIRQVVNGQRENRPAITVAPVKDGDVKVAKVIEGLIRHVEQYSMADLAYDTAFESAVTTGFGYFRITTEYCGDEGFDQDVCIRPIENQFSVHDDPHFTMPDASDRRYCFVDEWVDRDDFKDKYGFVPTSLQDADGEDSQEWFEDKRVKVAEYWRVRIEREEIAEPNPTLPPESLGMDAGEMTGEPRTRQVERKIVEQFLMTGDRIIQESNWSGVYLPIIPVFGSVTNIEGRKYRKSLIRDAKEPQRVNNYWLSAETEAIALQPKAPFIGAAGQFETDEQKWANANNANHAYLQYDIIEGAPPPARQQPPAFPQAMRETRMASIESMKAIMGIFDASLGARSNETSGVAIEARQNQGNNATYHFIDNMTRAIRYAGLAIIDLLPKVYDQPRIARIVDVDGTVTQQPINGTEPVIGQNMQMQMPVDIRQGKYDVVVRAGPSYQTARQENQRALADLVKAFPPLMQAAGDLVLKNMDFPDAEKFAERLMPAGAKDGIPPALKQQMDQMQQQLQHGAQEFAKLQGENQKLQLDVQRKDVEKMSAQIDAKVKDAQVQQLQAQMQMGEQGNSAVQHAQELHHQQQIETIKAAASIKETQISELIKGMVAVEVARVKAQMGIGQNMITTFANQAGEQGAADSETSKPAAPAPASA